MKETPGKGFRGSYPSTEGVPRVFQEEIRKLRK